MPDSHSPAFPKYLYFTKKKKIKSTSTKQVAQLRTFCVILKTTARGWATEVDTSVGVCLPLSDKTLLLRMTTSLIHRLSPESHAPTEPKSRKVSGYGPVVLETLFKTVTVIVKSFELQSVDGDVQTGSIFSHSPLRPPPTRGS